MKSEDILLISENFIRPTEQICVSWSQQWTVLVERVLWKVLELPQVIFYSLAHPCCAKIGFLIKPLADMNKMYQIHLCTYKDLCSLTDRQDGIIDTLTKTQTVISHTHSHPSKKRGERNHHMHHIQIYTGLQTSSFVKKKMSYRYWQNIKSCSILVKWNLLLR